MPDERTTAERQTAYTTIENEQARDALRVAEALFKPKPTTTAENHAKVAAVQTRQEAPRTPRILNVVERSEPLPLVEKAPKTSRRTTKERVAAIPASEHGRVQALATDGMTIRQVADLYEVAESEIERIVAD